MLSVWIIVLLVVVVVAVGLVLLAAGEPGRLDE
jgi:hypothetical protein